MRIYSRFNQSAVFLALVWSYPGLSFAMPVLKYVQIKNSSEFNLVFDGKIEEGLISSEYVNDIFQVNLKNVSVYPAKIIPIQGKNFSKIFAYQYAPKLVRCRFSLRGKAADFKRKIRVVTQGEVVTVKLELPTLAGKTLGKKEGEQEQAVVSKPTHSALSTVSDAEQAADALDEQALLQKVIRGTDAGLAINKAEGQDALAPPVDVSAKRQKEVKVYPAVTAETLDLAEAKEASDSNGKHRLTSSKPLPAIWSVLGKFSVVILLLCLLAALVKKVKSTPAGMSWLRKVGKFAQKKLIKDREMIQVISTHHLDPKKSLAVVKVGGRLLVLGVTNEAINLITQIPGEGDAAGFLDGESEQGFSQTKFSEDPAFADFLGLAKGKGTSIGQDRQEVFPQTRQGKSGPPGLGDQSFAHLDDVPSLVPSARSRIKNRLEGLKQL